MDPKPPQLQDENPPKIPSKPTQNHIRFSNTTTADKCNFDPFHQRRRKLERFMDTFRTVVIKIASSGGPLTAARQMLIEERLRDFFTDFHTPDHPTYSAMIHRAIRDLNEEGGSSEESISEFIRKQFDDLPWAHSTLLKHHLRKLCECGEIVVTSDLRYLLADAITNTTSNLYSDPRRQQMKRKWSRKRKQSRGRSRRRKKDKFDKESREDEQMEIIGEKNDLTEKQVEVIGGQYQVREEYDDMTGIENQVEEQQNKVIESESKEQENGLIGQNQEQEQENGVCEGQNQPIEQHNDTTDEQNQPPEQQTEVIEQENQPLELQHEVTEGKNYQEQQLEIVPELDALEIQPKEQQREATEDQSQLVGQRNEGDCALLKKPQSQQNTMSSLPPEAHPKLMITSPDLPGASQQLDLDEKLELSNPGHPDFCCQQKHMEPYLKTMTTSLDILVNSQQLLHLDHQHKGLPESHPTTMMLPPPTTVTTFDLPMVSKMLEQEQQPGFPNSEEPSELSDQQKPPESLLITVAASLTVPVNSKSLKQSQPELVKPPEAKLATLEEGNELSHTLQQMRKEQRQLRRQGQKDSKSKLVTEATVIEVLPSQHQQQPEVLNSEGLQERKSTEMEESSEVQQQQAKQPGRRKWAISKSKAMINSCLPLQHQLQLQLQLQQQPLVLNSEGLRERKSTEMEESSEVQQQQAKQSGRRKRTISKSKAMITQGVPMNSEQLEQEQLSELPNPETSPRIKLTTVEPFSEEQKQQPKVCRKRKAPESQPAMVTGSLDLPKYSEHQPGISFPEEPIELELETLKQSSLTERMQRQIKRWGQGISEYKPAVTSIVALLPSSQDPHQEQLELPNCERPQELNHTPAEESTQSTKQQTQLHGWQKLPISQPKTVTDSLDSPPPSQQLELEQKQELPSPEGAQEQQNQQPQEKLQRRQLRSRPPKPQPVVAETMADLDPSQHQHEKQQQPESRGRGRPSKPKSDTATTGGELSPSDHQNRHEQQQAIKSSAGEGIFFDTCGLQSQQQPELPSLNMSHELKPVEELSMTQDQQRQRAREKPRRRKSRPRSPNLKAAAATAMTELLSSQLQCEEQQQAEQQQPERRGRGRPPLPKPYTSTTVKELLPLAHQDQHQQQPERRGRGRPPKLKPVTATTKEEMLHSADQHSPQQQQQEEEEKPKCRGRGRPPKPKPDTDATMENLSLQKQQQQQPKCRGRGRHQKLDRGK